MIIVNCTHCKQRYKTDDDLAGDEIECHKCGTMVHVPEVVPTDVKINLNLKQGSINLKLPDGFGLKMPEGMKKPEGEELSGDLKEPEGLGLKTPALSFADSMNKETLNQPSKAASLLQS